MKFKKWAPPDLVRQWGIQSALCERIADRRRLNLKKYGNELAKPEWMDEAEREGRWPVATKGPDFADDLRVLESLITDARMEGVWASLEGRARSYAPRVRPETGRFLFSNIFENGQSQSLDLYAACLEAICEWMNIPNITPKQSARLLMGVATDAAKLRAALFEIQGLEREELWGIEYLLDDGDLENLAAIGGDECMLSKDSRQTVFNSFEFVARFPEILLRLQQRAEQLARVAKGFGKPSSGNTKSIHFSRYLSEYFDSTYGTPLHEYVATIASVVLGGDAFAGNVRARRRLMKNRGRRRELGETDTSNKKTKKPK